MYNIGYLDEASTPLNTHPDEQFFWSQESNDEDRTSVELGELREPLSFVAQNTLYTTSKYLSLSEQVVDSHPNDILYHRDGVAPSIPTRSVSHIAKYKTEVEQHRLKRGWRSYGTFACLAFLNFACAIDATILSVALPVIDISTRFLHFTMKLTVYLDNSIKPTCNGYSSILVWDKLPALFHCVPAILGVIFTHNWTAICIISGPFDLYGRLNRLCGSNKH